MIHVFSNLEEEAEGVAPFCNMTFEIVSKHFDEAANCWRLHCRADASPYDMVGFGVDLPMAGWTEQVSDLDGGEKFHSFWGEVRLHTQGAESDQLLALLADYYGLEAMSEAKGGLLNRLLGRSPVKRAFVSEIRCLAVGIQSDLRRIEEEPAHMKLFFDDNREDGRYAEVFLEVDLQADLAMLNEKDEDYRTDLVHWLSLPGNVNANPHPGAPGVVLH